MMPIPLTSTNDRHYRTKLFLVGSGVGAIVGLSVVGVIFFATQGDDQTAGGQAALSAPASATTPAQSPPGSTDTPPSASNEATAPQPTAATVPADAPDSSKSPATASGQPKTALQSTTSTQKNPFDGDESGHTPRQNVLMDDLRGEWRLKSFRQRSGRNLARNEAPVTITNDRIKSQSVLGSFWYQLNSTQQPKWIDLSDGYSHYSGVYELDGDRLVICHNVRNGGRSTGFESNQFPDSPNWTLMSLQRISRPPDDSKSTPSSDQAVQND